LIMADAIDVAINQKGDDEPQMLVDIATLTGAIKVALGSELFGLFANDDTLAGLLMQSAQVYGERGWRMPLFRDYHSHLVSAAADFANASNNRFGGAISAALFLQKFVGKKSWAHLDIYGWTDRPLGGYAEVGATGQGVQCLVGLVKSLR
jgi:leucyl aminopeptidase